MTKAERNAALAELHYQWVQQYAEHTPVDPGLAQQYPQDYRMHHVDMTASPRLQARLWQEYQRRTRVEE